MFIFITNRIQRNAKENFRVLAITYPNPTVFFEGNNDDNNKDVNNTY